MAIAYNNLMEHVADIDLETGYFPVDMHFAQS